MEQKIIKYKSDLYDQEVTLIFDDELLKLKGSPFVRRKLEEANESLRRLQENGELDRLLNRHKHK
jgi:LPS O-antigen subunit length determinant protein (WzzB/FepE family)